MPPYIELCHESISNHCGSDFEVILTSPSNIRTFIPKAGPFEEIENPSPAIKADYIRVNLLYEHGGIWMDSDFVALRNFAPMKKIIGNHGFVGFHKVSCGDNHIPVWLMMSTPKGKIITEYKNKLDNILAGGHRLFNWSALGADSLSDVIVNESRTVTDEEKLLMSTDNYFLLPERVASPVPWQHCEQLFHRDFQPEWYITEDTFGFMLFNNRYTETFKRMPTKQILEREWGISRLFKIALNRD